MKKKVVLIIFMILFFTIPAQNSGMRINSLIIQNISKPNSSDNPIMKEFFVSPLGNDENNGEDVDHPFGNISKAQEAVRAISDAMTGDIIVNLRGGLYFINETLNFNESDSGSNGFNIIYQNYLNEVPIISGGQKVFDWAIYQGNIWRAMVDVDDFRQIYVNGIKKTRARGNADFITSTNGDGHIAKDDRMMSWKNIQDVEFVYKNTWTLPRVQVDWVWQKNIYMQQPSFLLSRTNSDSKKEAPIWIENAFELLDEPGEWYFNPIENYLYYIPESGEDMTVSEVIVPKLETLINITGTRIDRVSNIIFKGILFQHGNWMRPSQYGINYAEAQANVYKYIENGIRKYEMSSGNIQCRYAVNITFQECNFTKLGTTAVDFREGSQFSNIIGCKFYDNAGIAIQVGEISNSSKYDPNDPFTVTNINIINNYITNCSTEYMSGPGIFTGYVRNIRIEHNTISNLPYTGISVGWGWSAQESIMENNSVKFNRIYGIVNYLYDGGGIYTLSTQPGLNVSYNVIHDSGNVGLYLDERTNGSVWSYNLAWDCDNEMQDHSMYEESIWNDVFNNYLEDYPRLIWCWYPERDSQQIWGIYPGKSNFPQDIYDMSGVEVAYQYLIPENEYYWKFNEQFSGNLLTMIPGIYWIGIVGICVFGGYYCYNLLSRTKQKEDRNGGLKE